MSPALRKRPVPPVSAAANSASPHGHLPARRLLCAGTAPAQGLGARFDAAVSR